MLQIYLQAKFWVQRPSQKEYDNNLDKVGTMHLR
jgi:hypothetical protein